MLPLVRDRIDEIAAGTLSLDRETRAFVRAQLGLRWVSVADPGEARLLERRLRQGELAPDAPFLNPLVAGMPAAPTA